MSSTSCVPGCDSNGYTNSSGWPSRKRWVVFPPFSYIAPIISSLKSSLIDGSSSSRCRSCKRVAQAGGTGCGQCLDRAGSRASAAIQSMAKIWLPKGHVRVPSTAPDEISTACSAQRLVDIEPRRVAAEARDHPRGPDERDPVCEAEPACPAGQSRDRLERAVTRDAHLAVAAVVDPQPARGAGAPSAAASARAPPAPRRAAKITPRPSTGKSRCPGPPRGLGGRGEEPRGEVGAGRDRVQLQPVAREVRAPVALDRPRPPDDARARPRAAAGRSRSARPSWRGARRRHTRDRGCRGRPDGSSSEPARAAARRFGGRGVGAPQRAVTRFQLVDLVRVARARDADDPRAAGPRRAPMGGAAACADQGSPSITVSASTRCSYSRVTSSVTPSRSSVSHHPPDALQREQAGIDARSRPRAQRRAGSRHCSPCSRQIGSSSPLEALIAAQLPVQQVGAHVHAPRRGIAGRRAATVARGDRARHLDHRVALRRQVTTNSASIRSSSRDSSSSFPNSRGKTFGVPLMSHDASPNSTRHSRL